MSFEKHIRTGLDAPGTPWMRILVDAGHAQRQDDAFIDCDSFHSKSEIQFANRFRLRFTDIQSHLVLTRKCSRAEQHCSKKMCFFYYNSSGQTRNDEITNILFEKVQCWTLIKKLTQPSKLLHSSRHPQNLVGRKINLMKMAHLNNANMQLVPFNVSWCKQK